MDAQWAGDALQVSAGDQVRFVPQTLPAAFRERLELDAKIAALRRAARGELATEDVTAAVEVQRFTSDRVGRACEPESDLCPKP